MLQDARAPGVPVCVSLSSRIVSLTVCLTERVSKRETWGHQAALAGVMPRLLALLEGEQPKSHAAALDLLAALTEDNEPICQSLLVRALTYTDAESREPDGRGFGGEIAHAAVSRRPPISLCTIVPRTHMYTYAPRVWALSIVQGPFSVAPCPNPNRSDSRPFPSPYAPVAEPSSTPGFPLSSPPPSRSYGSSQHAACIVACIIAACVVHHRTRHASCSTCRSSYVMRPNPTVLFFAVQNETAAVARVCALSKDRHETIRLLACATLANVARLPSASSATDSHAPSPLAALALPVTIKLVGFGNVRSPARFLPPHRL